MSKRFSRNSKKVSLTPTIMANDVYSVDDAYIMPRSSLFPLVITGNLTDDIIKDIRLGTELNYYWLYAGEADAEYAFLNVNDVINKHKNKTQIFMPTRENFNIMKKVHFPEMLKLYTDGPMIKVPNLIEELTNGDTINKGKTFTKY